MKLTVKNCLLLESFKDAVVLAGQGGMKNEVGNVTVLEASDLDDFVGNMINNILEGKELVLTAFFTIKDDVEKQLNAIKVLQKNNASGLVLFYIGLIVNDISPKLIDLCNELNFPLIYINPNNNDLGYGEVIRDIMQEIFYEDDSSKLFVQNILKEISKIKNKNKDLQSVMDIICKKTNSSIILINKSNKIVLTSGIESINKLKIIEKNLNNIISNYKNRRDLLKINLENGFLTIHSKLIDIGKIEYMLVVIKENKNIRNKNEIRSICEVIEIGANIWNYDPIKEIENELIRQLIKNNKIILRLLVEQLNINLNDIYSIIIMKEGKDSLEVTTVQNRIEEIYEKFKIKYIQGSYEDKYIFLIIKEKQKYRESYLKSFLEEMLIGNGESILLTEINDEEEISKLINTSIDVIEKMKLVYRNKNIFSKYDVKLVSQCINLLDKKEEYTSYLQLLEPIKNYDKKNNSKMLDTFGILLIDNDLNIKKSSQDLFIHQNTVQYRIKKIEEILGENINKSSVIFTYLIALTLDRLISKKNKKY